VEHFILHDWQSGVVLLIALFCVHREVHPTLAATSSMGAFYVRQVAIFPQTHNATYEQLDCYK
jgi:hypothetical protein